MSLILDALRKSEAERRRGQSPDLFASPPVAAAPRPGHWPRVLPLLLLVALALVTMLMLWPHRQDSAAVLAENASDPERSTNVDADAKSGGGDLAPPATDAALAIASPPSSTRRSPAAPSPDPTAAASDRAGPRGPAAQASSSTTARTSSPTPAAALASPRAGTGSTPMPTASAQSTPTTTSATPAPDADDNPGEALPPIAVLAASERAALPPLKLSMHVWNSEPRKRFAIIDGQRVTEGSTVGAGVIEEIRRDGVVLNLNGRRVLLPRP